MLALDRATGAEVWRTKLPRVRLRMSDFVGLAQDGDAVFATHSGEVFCLDAATGEAIIELMEELNRERGTTLVLVTHDPLLAGRARRTIRLADGVVVSDTASPEAA